MMKAYRSVGLGSQVDRQDPRRCSCRQEFEEVVKAYDKKNIFRVVVEEGGGISRRKRQLARTHQEFPHSTQYSSQREIGEFCGCAGLNRMGHGRKESRKGRRRNVSEKNSMT